MANLDEIPILDLGRNPVPGPQPCGTDAAEDEDFILIDAEINKLDRIEGGEPDWYSIENAAIGILRDKAKDVEVAASLGLALFKNYRYDGLAAVLGLLAEMANGFWDGCFPERPRRRKARVEWLADRFTEAGWFRDNQPQAAEFDAIDKCLERAGQLNDALAAKMPDEPAELGKFIRGLKELAAKRPKTEASAAAPDAAQPTATASAASAPSAGGGVAFAVAEVTDTSGAVNAVLGAVTFLRKNDPADPLPYAIIRAVKWSKIALPTSDAARTQIENPEPSVVESLNHQFNNGIWENLLKNAEAAFRSSDPLWLDLQLYLCTAMSRLGSNFDRARQAVMGATAALVDRLGEGLYALKFRNGTPLCGGQTRMWIEAEVAPPRGGGGGSDLGDGKLTEAWEKGRQLAAEGKLKEGLQALHEGLISCTQLRERFMWRLSIARLCCDAQRPRLAGPLLEECREYVQRHRLDEWEPSLAAMVAQHLYRCRKAVVGAEKEPTRESLQNMHDSFAWLCQMDPLAALTAEP